MPKYILFAGPFFYPVGGVDDYAGTFDTYLDAFRHFQDKYGDGYGIWAHVVVLYDDGTLRKSFEYDGKGWMKI